MGISATAVLSIQLALGLLALAGLLALGPARKAFRSTRLGNVFAAVTLVWLVAGPALVFASSRAIHSQHNAVKELAHTPLASGSIWILYLLNAAAVAIIVLLLAFIGRKHAT